MYINAVVQPEFQTPRANKVLIIVSTIFGQLFSTGYFFDAQDTAPISESIDGYVQKAAIVGIAASLLVIPLKVIISNFLAGKEITEKAKRKELDEADTKLGNKKTVGFFLIFFWLVGSGYAIAMFALSFTSIALGKWLLTFFSSFLFDVIIMFNIKMLAKVLVALILMSMVRSPIMLTLAGSISSYIVDTMMAWF